MPSKPITSELQMAIIVALRIWPGTSIIEGALWWMEEVRRRHPDQFKDQK